MVSFEGAQQFVVMKIFPILIILFVLAFVIVTFMAAGDHAIGVTKPYAQKFRERLERANVRMRAEDIAIGLLLGAAVLWGGFVFGLHPSPLIAVLSLPGILALVIYLFGKWVDLKIKRRLNAFNNQLELILRMMSSSIRAGLGLRQALILVTEEMPDPARHEFHLAVLQTNIGMSTNDALARLAQRMPSQEIDMMTRAIAVQSQTGGNLGKTLDHLASTIKDRRKLFRKVKAITSEARGSAVVIGALPILVGLAIMATQPPMRDALLHTNKGLIALGISLSLESLGIFTLVRLMKFKI